MSGLRKLIEEEIKKNRPKLGASSLMTYMRGRKVGKGLSLIYLSQSFFQIPKIMRQHFNYLTLLKLSSARDLNLILSDFSLGVDRNKLISIYKQATKRKVIF